MRPFGFTAPGIRGWHLHTTILLTPVDHAALQWLLQRCPGGLPDASWSLDLTRQWLDQWQTDAPTSPATWNAGADSPLVWIPWWFFLLSLGHSTGWKTLWRAQQTMAHIHDLTFDVAVPRLPHDRQRQRPMPWNAWSAGVSLLARSPEFTEAERATLCLSIAWRVAWWELWRQRAPHLPGTARPWWGRFWDDPRGT
jgi:hypothetical protein